MTPSSVVKASYWFPDGENQEQDPRTSAQTIPSDLFTHLFCAFADLDATTHEVFVPQAHESIFSTFTEIVKNRNKYVQTLLSIGGRSANNSAFASMASKQESRKSFIDSWISIARSKGFHGLDLAWEYPSNEHEMKDFGHLVRDLRSAVDAESILTRKPILLLTAAVYYSSVYKKYTYPVKVMEKSLDWVNIIAYDFYEPVSYSLFTAPTAGLHVSSNNKGPSPTPSGDSGLKQWIKDGLSENKAVMGFTYVGWGWTLENENDTGYHAPAAGVARHEGVSEDGSINYAQIVKFIGDEEATYAYDSKVVGHYCFAGKTWIGYEDNQSVVMKVKYAEQNGLLGYFAWNVGADDNTLLSTAGSSPSS
ncbi:PREDICTED: chitotriosidase-1-like [Camelina sativa]|uniref:Chitotriosidase-1-like n=1 Tax=Camelina sativa TaxID=90675 RepID=A0ABM1QHK0_CAMSA|nr:PREDICTED: chitotriosidase-1-like [Camelina sativa]